MSILRLARERPRPRAPDRRADAEESESGAMPRVSSLCAEGPVRPLRSLVDAGLGAMSVPGIGSRFTREIRPHGEGHDARRAICAFVSPG
jgi:hypothetical protein